jgi:hypothetical protein
MISGAAPIGPGPLTPPRGEAGWRTDRAEPNRDARGPDRSEKTRNLVGPGPDADRSDRYVTLALGSLPRRRLALS